ncbi:S1C family serine protease [Aeromicrobium endophyticum]|uniref:PDZ domain-containing protein n=1 Tax=Aeromicrobium endophyticum TaxID=2292704 RepID=A0A371PBJ0_9ACTN|nr:trypsin-like peptidase domain-containing protein [Aeromicrobium endophyticum]REK73289.1 PDZ domain-containing protein [Aeromicrobium endophyticum]
MTDSHDPFAERPYTPPTGQDGADATPAAQQPPAASTPHDDATPSPTDHEPTVEVPAQAPPAPPAPPVAEPVQSATPPPPPADDFTHRYPSQPEPAATYGDHEPTASFAAPAFAAPAYAAAGAGHHGAAATTSRPRRGGRVVAGGLAFLVLAAGAGYGGAWAFNQQDDGGDGTTVSSLDTSNKATQTNVPAGTVEQVANKVLPSVVQINVKGGQESGSGTGIIISDDGEILTNNHVVAVAGDNGIITVAFNDGTNAKAEIIGTDPKTDLAVIKAEGKSDLTPATLGTSSTLKVGQEVVAIGSPFGLESTVTQGIVSALNRPVSSSDGSGGERTTFPAVQTDAAINPGNSGGPLVDLQGRVIAINSAIRSGGTTSGEAGSIGLGFAIPVDLAKNVAKQLLAGKTVAHAQIGVTVDSFLGTDGITGIGAQVKSLTADGAGAKAGLKEGDVITSVNGAVVPSSEALVAAVRGFNPGEKVTVGYTRDGQKNKTEVTLGSDGGTPTQ